MTRENVHKMDEILFLFSCTEALLLCSHAGGCAISRHVENLCEIISARYLNKRALVPAILDALIK